MTERVNWAFGFPVVPTSQGKAMFERVTVRVDPVRVGESGFRIEYPDPAFRSAEKLVQEFRTAMRAKLSKPERLQRDSTFVNFTPQHAGPYVGNSFLMLAMIADHLAASRPDLFDDPDSIGNHALAIVATGEPDAQGMLEVNAQGTNIGGLAAKLRVVRDTGDDEFDGFDRRLLVIPDQHLDAAEIALIADIEGKGWEVKRVNDLGALLQEAPFIAGAEKVPAPSWITWPIISGAAVFAACLFAVGLSRLEEPVLPSPQQETRSAPAVYSGSLDVDVLILRQDSTYSAPIGNLFGASETIRLVLQHHGEESAQFVLFQDGKPVESLTIPAGGSISRNYGLDTLTSPQGQLEIRGATCVENACGDTLVQLLAPLTDAPIQFSVGDTTNILAPQNAALHTLLKFELM